MWTTTTAKVKCKNGMEHRREIDSMLRAAVAALKLAKRVAGRAIDHCYVGQTIKLDGIEWEIEVICGYPDGSYRRIDRIDYEVEMFDALEYLLKPLCQTVNTGKATLTYSLNYDVEGDDLLTNDDYPAECYRADEAWAFEKEVGR